MAGVDSADPRILLLRSRPLTTATTALATHHGSHTHCTVITATHDPHHAPTHALAQHRTCSAHTHNSSCTPHTAHALPNTYSTHCTYVNDDSPDTTDGKLPLIWLLPRYNPLHARSCITTHHTRQASTQPTHACCCYAHARSPGPQQHSQPTTVHTPTAHSSQPHTTRTTHRHMQRTHSSSCTLYTTQAHRTPATH
jgi:hypothetical protein